MNKTIDDGFSPTALTQLPPHRNPTDASIVQCWCGLSNNFSQSLAPAACNYKCPGDSARTCGGNDAMDVYQLTPKQEVETHALGWTAHGTWAAFATDPYYTGCLFEEDDHGTLVYEMSEGEMTNDACNTYCNMSGYYCAATRAGDE